LPARLATPRRGRAPWSPLAGRQARPALGEGIELFEDALQPPAFRGEAVVPGLIHLDEPGFPELVQPL